MTTAIELETSWGLEHFDPWDNRITYANIWRIYQEMRASSAVIPSDAHGGFYSLTRYDEVKAAARDYRTFLSGYGTTIGGRDPDPSVPPNAPIEFDPPGHTRFRHAMQAPFLPSRLGSFVENVNACVDARLDAIAEMKTFDIVTDLAEPVPQEVVSHLLGFGEEARLENRRLVLNVVNAPFQSRRAAWAEFRTFLLHQIRTRRRQPGDDFLSELCSGEFDGAKFTERELVGMLVALALAGHHTSINAISSLMRRMSMDSTRQAYQKDPSIGPAIIEETLRCDPPVHLEARTASRDVEIDGTLIPSGSQVALLYASANHDELRFADPESFDPARSLNQHLSFGHGIHSCFGMHLARLEMRVILEKTFARFPSINPAGPAKDTGMVYGHHMGWSSIPASVGGR